MTLWILIFIIIVLISLVLSILSMRDYQQNLLDSELVYGLFLVRRTTNITQDFLDSLSKRLSGSLISFERLFKGNETTLLIFGPKEILLKFYPQLDLLEIEDYAVKKQDVSSLSGWEFTFKNGLFSKERLYENFPKLSNEEEFWLQFILRPVKDKVFRGKIRAIIFSKDSVSKATLADSLQNLSPKHLIKLPKAYSDKQIVDFYIRRDSGQQETQVTLNASQVLNLIRI